MERVSIFHQEFARTHHAKARTHFITEFGLDLEEVQRQPLIRASSLRTRRGDNPFAGRAEYERRSPRSTKRSSSNRTVPNVPSATGRLAGTTGIDTSIAPALFISSRTMLRLFQDAQVGRQPWHITRRRACGSSRGARISWWWLITRRRQVSPSERRAGIG